MNWKRWLVSLILAFLLGFMLTGTAFAQTARLQTQAPSAMAAGKQIKQLEGTWNLRLQQINDQDEFNREATTEFRLKADLKYKPVENVDFRLIPKFTYRTGYTQTQELVEDNKSAWGVQEASINATPASFAKLSAGALNQSEDHPYLLFYEQAFPALRVKLNSSEENMVAAGIRAESAIPTSSSLSTQTKEFEKTPSLQSASLRVSVQKSVVEGFLSVGFYQFQNLPTSVATQSTFLGNTTISSTGAKDSSFRYDYQGPFAYGKWTAHLHRDFRVILFGEWVKNTQAPDGLNQGTMSEVKAEIDASRSWQFAPSYQYYKVEPDAAVSQYNAPWVRTNRVGYMAGFGVTYRKVMSATLYGGERDVVYTTPYQQREQTWILRLETFDVAI